MGPLKIIAWVVLAGALTSAGWIGLDRLFDQRVAELKEASQGQEAEEAERWEAEKGAQEAERHKARMEAREEHRLAAEKALGGPMEVTVKNPAFSLTEMLWHLTEKVVPPESKIQVRVERFVEFQIRVDLPEEPTLRQLAGWTRTLLQHGATYVHGLTFVHRGEVLAELDRRIIESNPEWAELALIEVESALSILTATNEVPKRVGAPGGASAQGESELQEEPAKDPEARRMREAEKKFAGQIQERHTKLKEVLEHLDHLTLMTDVRSRENLLGRLEELRVVRNEIGSIEQFFSDPAALYQKILEEAQADGVYVRAAVRSFNQREPAPGPRQTLFAALKDYADAVASLVETMQRNWGEWSVVPAQAQIQFNSNSAQRAYQERLDDLRKTGDAMNRAMAAWGKSYQRDAP